MQRKCNATIPSLSVGLGGAPRRIPFRHCPRDAAEGKNKSAYISCFGRGAAGQNSIDSTYESRYCVKMKNITVTVDTETYRRARMKAAEQDTSVSALVKGFLVALAADESDAERLRREERALRARVTRFRAADRLSREDTHARGEP